MSAALLGREAIDITASLADAAAPLAMGILEFTNPSDLYCRHGGLLAAGSLRTRTGRPSATRRAENKGKLTKHLQRPQPPNGRLMLKRSACARWRSRIKSSAPFGMPRAAAAAAAGGLFRPDTSGCFTPDSDRRADIPHRQLRAIRDLTRCSKGPSCSTSSSALATAKSSVASTRGRKARRCGRARVFFLVLFALGVGAALPTHDALDHHGRDAREHGLGHRG